MSFRGNRQLISLIKNQKNEEAKSFIKKGNLYNADNSTKNTLLHYAAKYNNVEIVQFLIESGSKVNLLNNLGQTPLMRCFESDLPCQKIIELLLRAGAYINFQDMNGESVLKTINNIEWLTEDARRVEILKIFLEQASDFRDFYGSLFFGNKDVIKALLDTKINLFMVDRQGKTLTHTLVRNCNPGAIEQLHGRNYAVDARDNDEWTPLMCAATNCMINAMEFLLSEGADIEATNDEKETALYIAFYRFFDEDSKKSVQLLLEHGANVQVETAIEGAETIFDVNFDVIFVNFELGKLPIAHLALQEALGTTITDLIRNKLNSNRQFKSYFENCKQQLSIKICSSITVFDLLVASESKLEHYFHNEELASILTDFQTGIGYFDTILEKRFPKARKMIALRKIAAAIVCNLIKINYDNYPFVIDEIVSYLKEQDIECLKLIKNELY